MTGIRHDREAGRVALGHPVEITDGVVVTPQLAQHPARFVRRQQSDPPVVPVGNGRRV